MHKEAQAVIKSSLDLREPAGIQLTLNAPRRLHWPVPFCGSTTRSRTLGCLLAVAAAWYVDLPPRDHVETS